MFCLLANDFRSGFNRRGYGTVALNSEFASSSCSLADLPLQLLRLRARTSTVELGAFPGMSDAPTFLDAQGLGCPMGQGSYYKLVASSAAGAGRAPGHILNYQGLLLQKHLSSLRPTAEALQSWDVGGRRDL